MRKTNILLCLLALTLGSWTTTVFARQKMALLVGISDYGHPQGSETLWQNISGANDVALLRPLLQQQGFHTDVLTDGLATYGRIMARLSVLARTCGPGDCVYLHFSMHGQPVEDRNGDEPDGWDESLVPVDAQKIYRKGVYEGACHLTDDRLSAEVNRIREKVGPTGWVYVVLDACHSGESSRGDTDHVRGTHQGFTWTGKIYKASRLNTTNDYFHVKAVAGWAPVAYLEACRSYQHNREIRNKMDNKWYGALSYYVARVIRRTPISSTAWVCEVKKLMDGFRPNKQNMVIESSVK